MADGNIFGLETDTRVDESLFEDEPAVEEPVAEEPVAEEEEAGAPGGDAGGEPPVDAPPPPNEEPLAEETEVPEVEVEETPVVEGTPVPDFISSDRDLSKFKTIEALADGYRNSILLHNRTAERAREAERAASGWKDTAEQALEMLKARQTPLAPSAVPADIAAAAQAAGVDEETLRIAQALAARETRTVQEQMQEQQVQREMQQQQEWARQQLATTVNGFFQAHPEVTQGSPEDIKLGEVIQYFDLNPSLPDVLERSYAVVQDPELEKFVRANPHLIDTDEGIDYAREQLALNKRLSAAASTHTAAQTEAARQAALRKASVETGASGTPPTSPGGENDEWAQVLAVARKDRGAEDIFGLGS